MIVFILPDLDGGGAQRVVVNLITGLFRRGISVELVVFSQVGSLVSCIPEGVIIHDLHTNTLRRSIIPLICKLRSLNPKVIFSTIGYINIGLLLFYLLLPRTSKIWIREANLPSLSLPNNAFTYLMSLGYRKLYRKADKIICTSQRMVDEFADNFKLPVSMLQIIPNPVNDQMIQSLIVGRTFYQNDKVNFIAMGRLTFQKGFDRLLHWFSKIENKDSVLRIIGAGPMEQDLKNLVMRLDLLDRVFFIGHIDNPWEPIWASDVFLLSSRWEGMPNAALESLVCGTPVIATAESGGVLELSSSAREGAVFVATTEVEFCKEMEKVKPVKSKQLKVSLLPERYILESVLDKFNSQLLS